MHCVYIIRDTIREVFIVDVYISGVLGTLYRNDRSKISSSLTLLYRSMKGFQSLIFYSLRTILGPSRLKF